MTRLLALRLPSWSAIAIREVGHCAACCDRIGTREEREAYGRLVGLARSLHWQPREVHSWDADRLDAVAYRRTAVIGDGPPHATGIIRRQPGDSAELLVHVPADVCPQCGAWMPRFADTVAPGATRTGLVKKEITGAMHPVPDETLTVLCYEETGRHEEPVGTERRRFDNSCRKVTWMEVLYVSRASATACTMSDESAEIVSHAVGVPPGSARIRSIVEQALRHRYGLDTTTLLTLEETTPLMVPANTDLEVMVSWKCIWALGTATVGIIHEGRDAALYRIPVALTVGLSYETRTRDISVG